MKAVSVFLGSLAGLWLLMGCSGGGGSGDQGKICAYDDDCEQHCTWGVDNQAPYCTGACDADRTCPEGYSCLSAGQAGLLCVMGSCSTDADCPNQYTCDTDTAVCVREDQTCTTDDECPAFVACNQGTCVYRCESEDDCKQDFVCDYLTRCVECTNNLHCENGYACENGLCNLGCIRDGDCRAGYGCESDLCARIVAGGTGQIGAGCAEDSECEFFCRNGSCAVSCNGEDDVTSCPSGYTCNAYNGLCEGG